MGVLCYDFFKEVLKTRIIDRAERIDVLGLCDEEDYFRWDSKEKLKF